MKPLLLIDVDGVLAPFEVGRFTAFDGRGGWLNDKTWAPKSGEYELHPEAGVFFAEKNILRLASLKPYFEFHWGTGWEHEANVVISPIHELDQLPVMSIYSLFAGSYTRPKDTHDYRASTHWKMSAIVDYVGDKPFAFIDDEIKPGDIEWAEHRNKTIPTFFCKTEANEGLTDDHIRQLREFAERVDL